MRHPGRVSRPTHRPRGGALFSRDVNGRSELFSREAEVTRQLVLVSALENSSASLIQLRNNGLTSSMDFEYLSPSFSD